MLKLYKFITNNGDWGGIHTEYAIAENENEAKTQCKYSLQRMEEGCDGWIYEMTGKDLLNELDLNFKNFYELEFTLKRKGDI